MEYDAFISHATEDKENLVRPLAEALTKLGYRVWYDEFTISVGDGLRKSIDRGISKSRFGIVVLSKSFFDKGWTEYELDGLIQIDINNKERGTILPIWYQINVKDVISYSPSLANKFAIHTEGKDLEKVIHELEKKLGDFLYTVDYNGKIIRSNNKVSIDILKRDKKFQLISSLISHRLFNKEKCVITTDSVIYPYSKDFNTLKFNHWQSNIGKIELIRHVAYDVQDGHLISTRTEILKNDGNNFLSAVEFQRQSSGPVRVISEIKTTNFYKSLFEEGSDENEIYHRLRIEHFSFSMYLPNHQDFLNLKIYINGEQKEFSPFSGGRIMKHEVFGTESEMTIYSLTNEENK